MSIRTKFILFIAVIHALALALTFYIFKENKLFFIASEVVILISLAISWSLYNDLIRPLQLLLRGVDAIRDRDFNVKFVETGKYEMDQLIAVYNQMMDQLRNEKVLQQEQHFFLEKLVQTSPTGIILLDYDDNIATINPKTLEITGLRLENLRGQSVRAIDHPVFETINSLTNGHSKTITLNSSRTFKIQKAQFIDRGFPCTFVMLEELTIEILEAEKKAYGKVIRMMAHEVNNSIGAVNSILDTTLQLQPEGSEIAPAIEVAIERNEHLSAFMRNFADVIRLPEPHKEMVSVNTLLEKVSRLMEYKARNASVQFELDLSPSDFQVRADAGQLEQVLINILKNAIEAIPDTGVVRISTRQHPAEICICDNGTGISPAFEKQLFSPFYSTKSGGQGIGLTLAREILTVHGWAFSLTTGADAWTCFRISMN